MKKIEELNLKFVTLEHPPIHTVEDEKKLNLPKDFMSTKNLFLIDKKLNKYFLVCMEGVKRMNIKSFQKSLGLKKLSFAKEEDLYDILGAKVGHVSILHLLNPNAFDKVDLILDKDFLTADKIGFHPNTNDNGKTLIFENGQFKKLIEHLKLEYNVIEYDFKTL